MGETVKNFSVGGAGRRKASIAKGVIGTETSRKKSKKETKKMMDKIEEQKVVLSIEDHIQRVSENWEAMEDRVVIFPDTPALKSAGGLFLPATSVAKPSRGTIVLIGPGEFNKVERMKGIAVGDRAVYGRFAGTDVELDGQLYTVVRISDIMLRDKKKVATSNQK